MGAAEIPMFGPLRFEQRFDAVLVDAFAPGSVPRKFCNDPEYMKMRLFRLDLRGQGDQLGPSAPPSHCHLSVATTSGRSSARFKKTTFPPSSQDNREVDQRRSVDASHSHSTECSSMLVTLDIIAPNPLGSPWITLETGHVRASWIHSKFDDQEISYKELRRVVESWNASRAKDCARPLK